MHNFRLQARKRKFRVIGQFPITAFVGTWAVNVYNSNKTETSMRKLRDQVLLVGSAVLVCVVGGISFYAAEEVYHINPAWVFFAWNSIFFGFILGKGFRRQFKKPQFVVFFVVWMALHGTVVVMLMRWIHMVYWVPFMGLELFIGFLTASLIFDARPERRQDRPQP